MRPSTIRYFLKEGFSGLKKNLLMTVASIIAVAACISIMSFSYCVVSNLQYMLDHNTHHAAELDQMADKLTKEGHEKAAEQIRKAVDEFQKGNLYLGLALSLVKEA